jgi:hypothetical protein
MPDESTSPATVVAEAPQVAAETPAPASSGQPATPAAEAPQETQRPDYKQLLQDQEARKALFSDPDFQREIEHRAKSEAGRIAKSQMETWQRQQEAAAQQQRLQEMPDDELGAETRRQMELHRHQQEIDTQANFKLLNLIGQTAAEALDPEDFAKLDPTQFHGPNAAQDYLKAALKLLPQKEAKALAKELAKKEAAAMVEERLGERRENAVTPPNTPAGSSGRIYTEAEISAMSLTEYRAVASDIDRAVKEGRIKRT